MGSVPAVTHFFKFIEFSVVLCFTAGTDPRDAENRLVEVDDGTTTVSYQYDYLGRRMSRDDGTTVTHYLYDGWNCIAEYGETTVDDVTTYPHQRSYVWGLDLSQSPQGAGGVGGLLSVVETGASTRYYPSYDGNGNVSEYVNQSGTEVAHFEYDPFGNLTVDDQSNAASFPYRFSTKPQDTVTGLYYYGYRYYDPVTGRWPSRDPIGELGGINVYAFIANDSISQIDFLGLVDMNLTPRNEPVAVRGMDNWNPQGTGYTVGGHGSACGGGMTDAQGEPLTPERLAELITSDDDYEEGQTVTLYMCNTGSNCSSGANFAQRLATLLGAGVRAPNGFIVAEVFRERPTNIWISDTGAGPRSPTGRFVYHSP